MHKDNVSGTLVALIAGATVGAGVGLLFAPQTGSQFRTSLREHKRKAPDEVDQATGHKTESGAIRSTAKGDTIPAAGAGCSMRSGTQDHTLGDTGYDN